MCVTVQLCQYQSVLKHDSKKFKNKKVGLRISPPLLLSEMEVQCWEAGEQEEQSEPADPPLGAAVGQKL